MDQTIKVDLDQMNIFEDVKGKPKLFKEALNHKHYAVISVLESHCVKYENKLKDHEMLPIVNQRLAYGKIKDEFEMRLLKKDIKNSETYLRIIGSNSTGTWLACESDVVDPNQSMKSRTVSSLETCIKNGVDVDYFFKILNDLKKKYYPENNQIRHQFNSEKPIIKRFSDDLIGKPKGLYNG